MLRDWTSGGAVYSSRFAARPAGTAAAQTDVCSRSRGAAWISEPAEAAVDMLHGLPPRNLSRFRPDGWEEVT